MEVVQDEDGEHLLSSRDLCTIQRLGELLPHLDALKIEGRSKSAFYVSAITKAYKHVRDALVKGTPIDETIAHLVNIVPHREYWDGFLFNALKDYPDGENANEYNERGRTTTH
jgi:putative protease